MIFLPHSIRRVVATASCGVAVLLFAACGGSGVGDDGWALDNPVGYTFVFDSTIAIDGQTAGAVRVEPTNAFIGTWTAKALSGSIELTSGSQCTYHKTGGNTFVYDLSGVHSPNAPFTSDYHYLVEATATGQDAHTKEIIGTTTWVSRTKQVGVDGILARGTGTFKIAKVNQSSNQ
ncbi:MAG: hypothetical protein RR506_09580 [Akkermansia sp.]